MVPALRKHTATVIWAHGLGDRWEGSPLDASIKLTQTAVWDGGESSATWRGK